MVTQALLFRLAWLPEKRAKFKGDQLTLLSHASSVFCFLFFGFAFYNSIT